MSEAQTTPGGEADQSFSQAEELKSATEAQPDKAGYFSTENYLKRQEELGNIPASVEPEHLATVTDINEAPSAKIGIESEVHPAGAAAAEEVAANSATAPQPEKPMHVDMRDIKPTSEVPYDHEAEKAIAKTPQERREERFEKSRVQNPDRAVDMATAENASITMSKNLEALGEAGIAKERAKSANVEAEKVSEQYTKFLSEATDRVQQAVRSRGEASLNGAQLQVLETFRKTLAGEKPEPISEEMREVNGKHFLYRDFRTSVDANSILREVWDPATGQPVMASLLAMESSPFTTKKAWFGFGRRYEVPSKAVEARFQTVVSRGLAAVPPSSEVFNPGNRSQVGGEFIGDRLLQSEGYTAEQIQQIRKKQKPKGFFATLFNI